MCIISVKCDFDTVRKNADTLWNKELSKIKITADDEIKENFYTALYHTMIMPTDFTDYNGEYVGCDKETHIADGYTYRTDMSLWDTARNVNALYCLIEKDVNIIPVRRGRKVSFFLTGIFFISIKVTKNQCETLYEIRRKRNIIIYAR